VTVASPPRAPAKVTVAEVSWLSPLARALLKAREGDIVEVLAPSGAELIEVLAIRYGVPER
jgi:transcription elongation factor GreB